MNIQITHIISFDPALMSVLLSSVSGAAVAQHTNRAASAGDGRGHNATDPVVAALLPAATEAGAVDVSGEVDAGGHPWSEALHASTKTQTKDGYWRMKVGVARPADLPGFPKSGGTTGTASTGAVSPSPATAPAANAGADDEDEFAAFRTAAAGSDATDAAAAASIPARKWTDADLSALCNQAATKLNDPAPIKEVIGDFVAEGVVPHSRNIADDQREAFAKALEAKAGITFAG